MERFREHYVRGLGMSARNNALAFGYSITATGSFGVMAVTAGPARVGRIFLFIVGAGLAFAVVNAVVTRGFRRRVEEEPPVVVALATSFSLVSASAAVGLAALLGSTLGGWAAWLLSSLLATWVYLGLSALEIALARNVHLTVSDVDPKQR
ncbi:MAG: hypothetical protein ACJ764_13945 [Solirubrobacteraceae bacterium]